MAYSEWLHFERRMLQRDLYGENADVPERARWVPCNTKASWFHFPLRESGLTWETMPSPARACGDDGRPSIWVPVD
jgi:hypothetical protein